MHVVQVYSGLYLDTSRPFSGEKLTVLPFRLVHDDVWIKCHVVREDRVGQEIFHDLFSIAPNELYSTIGPAFIDFQRRELPRGAAW